jgi:hypothetical protein
MATAVGIAVGLFATAAQARMAEFTETAIGCPSEDGMLAVYQAANENSQDFKTVQAVVDHYECEWIEKGVKLTLISQNPLVSVVVRPHVFGKDVWYYVPTRSVRAEP